MTAILRSASLALLTLAVTVALAVTSPADPPPKPNEATGTLKVLVEKPAAPRASADTWTFVSIPDFLNVDTTYPQPGWEETLDYVLKAIRAENPDFVLVPGDLVMGRWWSEEKIAEYAAIYYPAWIRRMEAHGLEFYVALGDHEIGDNPWPPDRARLVPAFRKAFRDYLKMPLNGPEGLEGTAYYFLHKNTLFVAIDVFEPGEGEDLPQEGPSGPMERVRIAEDTKERGFTTIGTMTVDKSTGKMVTGAKTGCFTEAGNPRE
jgi:hypothetical protein